MGTFLASTFYNWHFLFVIYAKTGGCEHSIRNETLTWKKNRKKKLDQSIQFLAQTKIKLKKSLNHILRTDSYPMESIFFLLQFILKPN